MKLKKLYLEPPTDVTGGRRNKSDRVKSWRVFCDDQYMGHIYKHQGVNLPYFTCIIKGVTGAPKKGEDYLGIDGVYRPIRLAAADSIILKEHDSLKEIQKYFREELERHFLSYLED